MTPKREETAMKLVANAAMRRALDDSARAQPRAPAPAAQPPTAAAKKRSPEPPRITASAAGEPATYPVKQQQRYASNKRIQRLLQERWPRAFSWARPLAIGIHEQITADLGDEIGRDDLRAFLRMWVNRPPYRAALDRGDRRVNLDLTDAGPAFRDDADARQPDAA
jgi:ProQ/FINO family